MMLWENKYELCARLAASLLAVLICIVVLSTQDSWFCQYSDSVQGNPPVCCGLFKCDERVSYLIAGALSDDSDSLFKADPCRPRTQLLGAICAFAIMGLIALAAETVFHFIAVARSETLFESVRYLSCLTCLLQFLFMVLFFAGYSANFEEGNSQQCSPGSYQAINGVYLNYGPFLVLVCFLFHMVLVVRKFFCDWRRPEEAVPVIRTYLDTESVRLNGTAPPTYSGKPAVAANGGGGGARESWKYQSVASTTMSTAASTPRLGADTGGFHTIPEGEMQMPPGTLSVSAGLLSAGTITEHPAQTTLVSTSMISTENE